MTTPWINTFQQHYYPHLNINASGAKRGLCEGIYCRAPGFAIMFEKLLANNQSAYHIIETGTLRNPGNWKDGQSAKLFTEFVDCYGGTTRSVDIDPTACNIARTTLPSANFSVACSDSVEWLAQQTDLDQVDLFYLDSYDVEWENDTPSAEHHLKEFLVIESKLKTGAIVVIDDNARFRIDGPVVGGRTGKGRRVVEYLEAKGIKPVYDAYQIIYQF
jgi:hypothetical protein